MKRIICVALAAVVLFASIHVTEIQTQAEEMQEKKKDISECIFVDSLGERSYKVPYHDTCKQGIIRILPSQRYTGNAVEPKLAIMDGNYLLVEGKDYKLFYDDTRNDERSSPVEPYCGSFLNEYGNEEGPIVDIQGIGNYYGKEFFCFAILSENQEETEDHLIYSDKKVLAGYDGVTIDGYVGAETEVEVPLYIDGKPVQEINENAFAYNPTLEKVDISDNVFQIMDGAFFRCGRLKEVKFSNQLWGIGSGTFAGCKSLKEITLPASLKKLGFQAFSGSTTLAAVHSESESIYDVDGVLFDRNGGINGCTNELCFFPPAKEVETYRIPDGTQWVGSRSFRQAEYVKNIIIPQSVSSVAQGGLSAFGGKAEISGETEEEISQNAVNIIFNHDEPTNDILDPKIPFSYTLPAGSTITVKNETMKAAAEAAVSEQYKDNVTVRIATKTSEGFELARNAFILSKEEQAQLCWTMIPADTTENVTWQSKNPAVAEVDPIQGKITAKGYGKCIITGTDESGHTQDVDVFVYDACTKPIFMLDYARNEDGTFKEDERYSACVLPELTNGKKEGNFVPGGMKTAVAFADGYAGDMPIRFENSARDVVTIRSKNECTYRTGTPTEDGGYVCRDNKYMRLYLEFLKPGTAIITAVFDDNGKEICESITVHVGQPGGEPGSGYPGGSGVGNLQDPGNQDETENGKQDQELQCIKSIRKAYGSKPFVLSIKRGKGDGRLTYLSSNPKVAKVEKGKVTIKGTGRTVITVTAGETVNYRKKVLKVTVDVTPKKQKAGVKAAGRRKLKVRWKKDAHATGYEVQYSTDRKFRKGVKGASVKKKGIFAKTLARLKKGKTYYVRVRAYKSVKFGSKKIRLYGSWSSTAKSRKIK